MTDLAYDFDGPCCDKCGAEMVWARCWNGCEDGEVNMYDCDPSWYGSYDEAWRDCEICHGQGGWYVCPVCHPAALDE